MFWLYLTDWHGYSNSSSCHTTAFAPESMLAPLRVIDWHDRGGGGDAKTPTQIPHKSLFFTISLKRSVAQERVLQLKRSRRRSRRLKSRFPGDSAPLLGQEPHRPPRLHSTPRNVEWLRKRRVSNFNLMLLGEHYAKPPIWLIIISLLTLGGRGAVEFGQVGTRQDHRSSSSSAHSLLFYSRTIRMSLGEEVNMKFNLIPSLIITSSEGDGGAVGLQETRNSWQIVF